MSEKFGGFPSPTSNFFSMPNAWTDITAEIDSLAELKVIEYVLRHTWGFHEFGKPKSITVDEFMHGRKHRDGKSRMDKGTGLSKHSVIDGLKKAIERGYLICEVDNADKARIVKAYALKMFSSDSGVQDLHSQNRGEESAPQRCKIYTTEVQDLHCKSEESAPRSEKETLERNLKKNKIERKNDEPPTNSEPESFSHSFNHSSFLSSSPEKPEVVFSQEEESIYTLAEKLDLVYLKRDANHKESCAKLIKKGVTTQEKMESLITHCKQVPFLAGKTLNLKNLVNELAGWLQLQRKATAAPSSSPIVSTIGKSTAELLAEQEAIKQRILQKDEEQGGRRASLQELVAAQKREKFLKGKLAHEAALARGENPL